MKQSSELMPPRVSVVIATYNYGHYLAGAVESVLAQTFADWELIVVDDGSIDDTAAVIEPYLNDPRIRYLRTENRGQPAAENTGIRASGGSLVAFLDADDLWLPEKLAKQVALFDADPELGVVSTQRITVDPSGRELSRKPRRLSRDFGVREMFRNNFVCFSSSMVARRVFDDAGLFNEDCRHASDYELWLRVALTYRFDYVDEPLVKYRTGHANLTSRGDVQLKTALRVMDVFVAQHPEVIPWMYRRRCYAETYMHLGQAMRKKSRLAAVPWFARALATSPVLAEAWRDLISLVVPKAARRAIRRVIRPPATESAG